MAPGTLAGGQNLPKCAEKDDSALVLLVLSAVSAWLSVERPREPVAWQEPRLVIAQDQRVNCVAFAADEASIWIGGSGVLRQIDIATGARLAEFEVAGGDVYSLSVSNDGEMLLADTGSGSYLVDCRTGDSRALGNSFFDSAVFWGDAVAIMNRREVTVWSRAGEIQEVFPLNGETIPVAFSSKEMAFGDLDGGVTIHDRDGSRVRHQIHAGPVTHLVALSGSRWLSAGVDGTLKLWRDGTLIASTDPPPSRGTVTANGRSYPAVSSVTRLEFATEGGLVLVETSDTTSCYRDLTDLRIVPGKAPGSGMLSPSGRLVAYTHGFGLKVHLLSLIHI